MSEGASPELHSRKLSGPAPEMAAAELRQEVIRLGPWHIDLEITPEVSTRAFLDAPTGTYPESYGGVTFHDPHDGFLRRLGRAFPNGLEGRSVLDCACNCGAYLFFAKEAGAGRCLGFDVREHWIKQARFLADHRRRPSDDMRFEVCDLYDLGSLGAGRFDVTFFFGIFYHLPDPVTGLKLAADLTDELLIVNSATMAGRRDGLLVADDESETRLMSGTYGLSWLPTGPVVLTRILNWLGFPEVRCSVWRHAPRQRRDLDRVEVLAARTPGFFSGWDAAVSENDRIEDLLRTRTAPGTLTPVLTNGTEIGEVQGREVVRVESARESGEGVEEVIGRLDRHRREGARYIGVANDAIAALGSQPGLAAYLDEQGVIVFDASGLRLYELHLEV